MTDYNRRVIRDIGYGRSLTTYMIIGGFLPLAHKRKRMYGQENRCYFSLSPLIAKVRFLSLLYMRFSYKQPTVILSICVSDNSSN
jgi:hypothetical protein